MILHNKRYIDQVELLRFVKKIRRITKYALRQWDKNPVSAHNALTQYSLAMLYFSTAHRPVVDPFCYRQDIHIDRNRCIVSDKVVSSRHEYRIAPLCETAAAQLKFYIMHLKQLKLRLESLKNDNAKALSYSIGRMIDNKENHDIPMFFLLDELGAPVRSIIPGEQQSFWNQLADIPLNYGRSFLATELFKKGIAPDMVEALLNHTDGVRHFFGPRSIRSPMGFVTELQAPIDELILSIGFEPIGPIRHVNGYRKRGRKQGERKQLDNVRLMKNENLGSVHRHLEREKRQVEITKLVYEQIKLAELEGVKRITEEAVSELENQILLQAKERRLSESAVTWQLYAVLMKWRKSGVSIQGIGHRIRMQVEGSPIKQNNFKMLREYDDLAAAFITHLDKKSKESRNKPLRPLLSELILSAALFGGLANQENIMGLPGRLKSEIYVEGGILSLEFDDSRWFPDNLSKAFIIGHIQSIKKHPEMVEPDRNEIKKGVQGLLKEIGFGVRQKKDVISYLEGMARVYLNYYSPGFIRSAALGERASKSLPASAWVRLIRDERLDCLAQEDTVSSHESNELESDWLPNLQKTVTEGSLGVKTFCKKIKNLINIEIKGLNSKDARRSKGAKKLLAKSILNFQETNNSLSLLESLLCAWIWKLCGHGPVKKEIKLETIMDYFFEIGEPLLSIADHNDFLDLNDFEYEEIYLRVLDYGSLQKGRSPIGRLFDFHTYLIDHYLVESPDWSVLFAEAGLKASKPEIDANLITHQEYLKCLEICVNDESLFEQKRYQYGCILLLGYWFQLRFGEAVRLQFRDIQFTDDLEQVWVQVTNNIFHRLKSSSGVRQVPLLGSLTGLEKQVLHRVLTNAKMNFEADNLAALLTSDGTRDLIDRGKASRYINELLKFVTGDPAVRFHHFRHAGFTRLIVLSFTNAEKDWKYLLSSMENSVDAEKRAVISGNFDIEQNPLVAAADIAGHSSEAVTLSSYFHLHDVMKKIFLNKWLPELNRDILSYAMNEKYGTLQQRIKRFQNKGIDEIETGIRTNKIYQKIREFLYTTIPINEIQSFTAPEEGEIQLSLLRVHRILEMICIKKRPLSSVSDGVGIDLEHLKAILCIAFDVERESGFNRYRVETVENSQLIINSITDSKELKQNRLHNLRLINLLSRLDRKFIEHDVSFELKLIRRGLQAWIRAHKRGELIFVTMNEIENFITAFETLGFEGSHYVLDVPLNSSLNSEIQQLKNSRGITVFEKGNVSFSHEKSSTLRENRAELSIELHSEIKTNNTLNAMMFCLAILLRVKNNLEL